MIELGEHAQFIVWGYIGVAAGTLALTAWVLWQPQRAMPPKMRVFVDYLAERLR